MLALATIILYLLHQDFWFWRAATPLVFGFLPIGLFYHVCYTLVVTALMWLLVRRAWPSQLETEGQREGETERRGDGESSTSSSLCRSVVPSLPPSVSPSPDFTEARRQ
jgi:hypothetical protein